jgi:hypothetical protein
MRVLALLHESLMGVKYNFKGANSHIVPCGVTKRLRHQIGSLYRPAHAPGDTALAGVFGEKAGG